MDRFEALWAYQTEDIKADAIANEIKRSPTRQRLEKSRDFIVERQKQYKQIEDSIAAIADRKDILEQALDHALDEMNGLKARMESIDPEDEEALAALKADVGQTREQLRSFEKELSQMNSDSARYDKDLRAVRVEAAKAKQAFDQLKVDYENESKL